MKRHPSEKEGKKVEEGELKEIDPLSEIAPQNNWNTVSLPKVVVRTIFTELLEMQSQIERKIDRKHRNISNDGSDDRFK